jgi:hypothetical protein
MANYACNDYNYTIYNICLYMFFYIVGCYNKNLFEGEYIDLSKYYTKQKTINEVIFILKENTDIRIFNLVLDPSSGNNNMINTLKRECEELTCDFLSMDIEPELNCNVIKKDFLTFNNENLNTYKKENNLKVLFISNPPWGFKSCTVIKFIKHITQKLNCDTDSIICFILPLSFLKPSLQKYFPLNWWLINTVVLESNSYYYKNAEYNIPSCLQIWKKCDCLREKTLNEVPNGYTFVKNPLLANISITRIGYHTGKISTKNLNTKTISTHYFLNIQSNTLYEKISNESYLNIKNKDFVVGARSISKNDVIIYLNNYII